MNIFLSIIAAALVMTFVSTNPLIIIAGILQGVTFGILILMFLAYFNMPKERKA